MWRVSDLVGSEVLTEEGVVLGQLKDVLPTRANDVFVVVQGDQEILIPALKTVVMKVSPEEKRITVRLPKGLEEVYAPKPK